jgi:hypothetical protein
MQKSNAKAPARLCERKRKMPPAVMTIEQILTLLAEGPPRIAESKQILNHPSCMLRRVPVSGQRMKCLLICVRVPMCGGTAL